MAARLPGTVRSAMLRIVPSWLMNTMSREVMVFFIHMIDVRALPQSNSMPPSAGTEGRNISPISCCWGGIAISTMNTCSFP